MIDPVQDHTTDVTQAAAAHDHPSTQPPPPDPGAAINAEEPAVEVTTEGGCDSVQPMATGGQAAAPPCACTPPRTRGCFLWVRT